MNPNRRERTIARATACLNGGRFGDAEKLLSDVLASSPGDAVALHLMGIVAITRGDSARAIDLISRALALVDSKEAHSNLAAAFAACRRFEEARASYERALALHPEWPEALHGLGVVLHNLGRTEAAAECHGKAVALRPDFAQAWADLGLALCVTGRYDRAIAACETALGLNASTPELFNTLGIALQYSRAFRRAAEMLRQAVTLRPDYVEAWSNLGGSLGSIGEGEAAADACRRALQLRPDYTPAMSNLGNALRLLGRFAEAETLLNHATSLAPNDMHAYNALAQTLADQHRMHEARAVLEIAADVDPDDPETAHHRALLLLSQGNFAEGFALYDKRLETRQAEGLFGRFAGHRLWQGEPLAGRRILLVAEQGLGDALQFLRYVPPVAARGGTIALALHAELLRLGRNLPGIAEVVGLADPLPPFDLYCPLQSLPRLLPSHSGGPPAEVPYLSTDPAILARWRAHVTGTAGLFKLGLVWGGNPRHPNDSRRSMTFSTLAPLLRLPGLRAYSLQLGPRGAELDDAPAGVIEDLAPWLIDFAETAGALAALDLLVTVDTSVAHMAGALGLPVWVMLPYAADWRWLRFGNHTPWYPTARLFRQDDSRRWEPVVASVAAALHEIVG